MTEATKRNVTVIGAGIVGTVCANYLLRDGHEVTLIDRLGPGEATSFGNAGGISPASVVPIAYPGMIKDVPKWLLDPDGPLYLRWSYLPHVLPWLVKFLRAGRRDRVEGISQALASLNLPTFEAYRPLLRDAGLEHLFHQTGQLFVYRTKEGLEHDRLGIDLKRATGLRVDILNADEIRQLEPTWRRSSPPRISFPTTGIARIRSSWCRASPRISCAGAARSCARKCWGSRWARKARARSSPAAAGARSTWP